MKIKKFDATNTVSLRRGASTISFGKGGGISISGAACRAIGLAPGNTVSFIQDEENPQDWFLTQDEAGFALRSIGGESKGAAFNCAALTSTIREMIGWQEEKAAVCRLITTPVEERKMLLYPVILSSAKKIEY